MAKGRILVVDDVPESLVVLTALLNLQKYEVVSALTGEDALNAVQKLALDLVLMDIHLPDMSGYEVCQSIRGMDQTRDLPVVFVSSSGETNDKVRAFRSGGTDYITKPLQIEEVIARVESQVTLYQQRRELERLREAERTSLEELNRMKDKFVATVSHDLKSPIGLIISCVELLKDPENTFSGSEIQDVLKIIEQKAQFTLSIVTNLLDLARIEAGIEIPKTEVSLSTLLLNTWRSFEVAAQEKMINLALTEPAIDQKIEVDEAGFEQILSNLISNAIKYTPEKGHIEIIGEVTDNYAIIKIIDSGFGIPPEDLPHLFEKFYRVSRPTHMKQPGSGLGLSIVKALVEQHEGQIYVESVLGEGSTFTLKVPLKHSNKES